MTHHLNHTRTAAVALDTFWLPIDANTPRNVKVLAIARAAFECVQQGIGTEDNRDILAGTANVVMVLAEKHCTPDDLAAAIDAQEALLRADCRAAEGKRWGFDAPGRMALLRMLDAHEQMLATFGCAALTDALCTVMDRRAKGLVHRIVKTPA